MKKICLILCFAFLCAGVGFSKPSVAETTANTVAMNLYEGYEGILWGSTIDEVAKNGYVFAAERSSNSMSLAGKKYIYSEASPNNWFNSGRIKIYSANILNSSKAKDLKAFGVVKSRDFYFYDGKLFLVQDVLTRDYANYEFLCARYGDLNNKNMSGTPDEAYCFVLNGIKHPYASPINAIILKNNPSENLVTCCDIEVYRRLSKNRELIDLAQRKTQWIPNIDFSRDGSLDYTFILRSQNNIDYKIFIGIHNDVNEVQSYVRAGFAGFGSGTFYVHPEKTENFESNFSTKGCDYYEKGEKKYISHTWIEGQSARNFLAMCLSNDYVEVRYGTNGSVQKFVTKGLNEVMGYSGLSMDTIIAALENEEF